MSKNRVLCGSMILLLLLTSMVAGCSSMPEQAASVSKYPAKPITIIVPYAAGGTADIMARSLEKVAPKYLHQPLVVTNITGGAGTIGWNELAGAKTDGYTIGYISASTILQTLYGQQTRYHYPTAIEPLAQVISTPIVAVIRADQQWKTINDLVEYAKQHPGDIKYGHSGLGSGNHVVGEIFAKEAKIDIKQVPFKGESEAIAALLGGHIQLAFINPSLVAEYVDNGQIRLLAVSGDHRLTQQNFKDVPTFSEAGLQVVFYAWQGLGMPKGLSPEIKKQLTEGLEKTLTDPEFIENMIALKMPVEYLGSQEFSQKWLTESANLSKMVKETGLAEKIAAQKQ